MRTAISGPRDNGAALMLYGGGGNQAVTSNKPGTAARPPAWRRTKREVVDDKIERMLETYKLMDEMTSRKAQAG